MGAYNGGSIQTTPKVNAKTGGGYSRGVMSDGRRRSHVFCEPTYGAARQKSRSLESLPVSQTSNRRLKCEALRPAFPFPLVSYDSKKDTPETVEAVKAGNGRLRAGNARFASACP